MPMTMAQLMRTCMKSMAVAPAATMAPNVLRRGMAVDSRLRRSKSTL